MGPTTPGPRQASKKVFPDGAHVLCPLETSHVSCIAEIDGCGPENSKNSLQMGCGAGSVGGDTAVVACTGKAGYGLRGRFLLIRVQSQRSEML
eukprot:s1218_g7.t1